MTRFPQIATHVGAAEFSEWESEIGPDDEDGEDDDNGSNGNVAMLAAPEEP